MRADLEALVHSTIKGHFAAPGEGTDFTWTLQTGGPPISFTATPRTGVPDGPFASAAALTLMVRPEDVPSGADAGDTVNRLSPSQEYRVIEVRRRESSLTVVTLEKVD